MVKTGAIVIIVLILIAIVVGFFFIFSGDDSTTQEDETNNLPPADDQNTDVTNQVPANQGDDVDEMIVNQDDNTPSDEPNDTPPPTDAEPQDLPNSFTIEMTDSGFSPSNLEITQGDTVIFSNVGTRGMWPATNAHPSHTLYPGSGASKCGTSPDTIFDSCGEVAPGDSYSFTFNEVGTWRYHDHRRSGNGGTIIVN